MLTRLQIVNRAMTYAGLSELTSLTGVNGPSVESNVERFIDDENRKMQNENRWSVTQRYNEELTPDVLTKFITLPVGAQVTSVTDTSSHRRIICVGDRLFDQDNNTYEFDDTVKVNVSYLYDVACIPEHLQNLVAARAALRLVENRKDGTLYQTAEHRQREAYANACRVDGDIMRHSAANTNTSTRMRGDYVYQGRRWA